VGSDTNETENVMNAPPITANAGNRAGSFMTNRIARTQKEQSGGKLTILILCFETNFFHECASSKGMSFFVLIYFGDY
jgi:hypothetical protein